MSATTPADLRSRAAEIVGAFDRVSEILAAADAADLADDRRLEINRDKLCQHEAACDPEKLADFQLTAAMKAQLSALESKVAKDKAARRAAANREAAAVVQGVNLREFFIAACKAEHAALTELLSPYFFNAPAVPKFTATIDSVVSLQRWVSLAQHPSFDRKSIAQRLRAFVSSEVPLWKI